MESEEDLSRSDTQVPTEILESTMNVKKDCSTIEKSGSNTSNVNKDVLKNNVSNKDLNTKCSLKNSNIDNSKKKKRRRRRKGSGIESSKVKESLKYSSPSSNQRICSKAQEVQIGSSTPVLRPVGAQVPRAPENSTQFIMDDHENSFMYLGFETENNEDKVDQVESKGSSPLYKYTLADFESEYKNIREEQLMTCTTEELKSAIIRLEAKAAVVTDALSASPSRLLERLQTQLLNLQEENKSLRMAAQRKRDSKSSSSSSSSESDSDSDSTSSDSSSQCSVSSCGSCSGKLALDEEKENTSPKPTFVSSHN